MKGRKQGTKNKNFHYLVSSLDDDLKIKKQKYFRTWEHLNNNFRISKTTLNRLCKGGNSIKYKWLKFERVNIPEELGNFYNDLI